LRRRSGSARQGAQGSIGVVIGEVPVAALESNSAPLSERRGESRAHLRAEQEEHRYACSKCVFGAIADQEFDHHLEEGLQEIFSLSREKKGATTCLNDGNEKKLGKAMRFGQCSARVGWVGVGERGLVGRRWAISSQEKIPHLCWSLRSSLP